MPADVTVNIWGIRIDIPSSKIKSPEFEDGRTQPVRAVPRLRCQADRPRL